MPRRPRQPALVEREFDFLISTPVASSRVEIDDGAGARLDVDLSMHQAAGFRFQGVEVFIGRVNGHGFVCIGSYQPGLVA